MAVCASEPYGAKLSERTEQKGNKQQRQLLVRHGVEETCQQHEKHEAVNREDISTVPWPSFDL